MDNVISNRARNPQGGLIGRCGVRIGSRGGGIVWNEKGKEERKDHLKVKLERGYLDM